ncbi:Ger(x)C family spore germination protein [Brevibacillus sp. DP1.3A]|uniref:Ger(x)C family spore germination protein n=1 Tax=Brevibacillus sp. DP1.3A TaxID=2738867 RepID=UPI00156ACD7F|nr:Ger(x)C family spore germination protein [Brevibacillus sp. DP1.3A]UED76028.1 Ger(x)C family spore germination protein [Brevibacillus sp. DP1.3A]
MARIRAIAALLLLPLLLSGCWNAREIENLLYVNALGVDFVDNKFEVYAQILSFSTIAKQEAGGERSTSGVAIAKGSGDSFVSALFSLYPANQEQMTWSHIRSLVLSEQVLKSPLLDQVIDELDRFYEFRYTIWTYATKDPLMDILTPKQVFKQPVIYSQLSNPQDLHKQNSVIYPMKLFQFVSKRDEPNKVVYLPMLSINRKTWSEDNKPLPQLKTTGACMLQNKEVKGCWPRSELLGLRWLDKHTNRSLLTLKKGKQPLANLVLQKPKVKIQPLLRDNQVTFQIDVELLGFIPQYHHISPVREIEKEAAKKIEEQIRGLYEKGRKQQMDTLQLGHTLYRKYPQEWKRMQQNGALPLQPSSLGAVNVKVTIYDGGISKVKQVR